MPARRPLEERFWEKVNKSGPIQPHMVTACWTWEAASSAGYGQIGIGNGKLGKAHKVSWELRNGPIPVDRCVLHKCDVPLCVNPDHLFLGTQKDNADGREKRGRGNQPTGPRNGKYTKPERAARGTRHGNAVLTVSQVREIRRRATSRYGGQRQLASEFGVDVQTTRRVVSRHSYVEEG